MIRYEDISADDMANYWGPGCVFLQHAGKWNAYNLDNTRALHDGAVRLVRNTRMGKYGDPPDNVSMTFAQFFEAALLHRPPLGVLVRGPNDIYLLGWQHADGQDMVKALRDGDVYVVPIAEKKPKADSWLEAWKHAVLQNRRLCGQVPRDLAGAWPLEINDGILENTRRYMMHPDLADGPPGVPGVRKQAVKLVLAFLNQTAQTVREALSNRRAAPHYLSGTAWLKPCGDNMALMAGRHQVGIIPAAGSCGLALPHLFKTDDNPMKALVGERLFATLY